MAYQFFEISFTINVTKAIKNCTGNMFVSMFTYKVVVT